jgi:hypothetical protein
VVVGGCGWDGGSVEDVERLEGRGDVAAMLVVGCFSLSNSVRGR